MNKIKLISLLAAAAVMTGKRRSMTRWMICSRRLGDMAWPAAQSRQRSVARHSEPSPTARTSRT